MEAHRVARRQGSSWLIDGSEVVSLMHGLPFTPRRIAGTHFCYSLNQPRAIVWLEGLGRMKNRYVFIGNRTRDLPSCTIVPQPTTLPHTSQYLF
jgi:hypothetical protein